MAVDLDLRGRERDREVVEAGRGRQDESMDTEMVGRLVGWLGWLGWLLAGKSERQAMLGAGSVGTL